MVLLAGLQKSTIESVNCNVSEIQLLFSSCSFNLLWGRFTAKFILNFWFIFSFLGTDMVLWQVYLWHWPVANASKTIKKVWHFIYLYIYFCKLFASVFTYCFCIYIKICGTWCIIFGNNLQNNHLCLKYFVNLEVVFYIITTFTET